MSRPSSKSSDDSLIGRSRPHPRYELHQTCERDTNVTGMTGDTGISISEREDEDYELTPDFADRLVKRTEMRVAQVVASSVFVQSEMSLYDLPRFKREDLNLGSMSQALLTLFRRSSQKTNCSVYSPVVVFPTNCTPGIQ